MIPLGIIAAARLASVGGGGSGDPHWANVALLVRDGSDVVTPARSVACTISPTEGRWDVGGAIDLTTNNGSMDWQTYPIAIGLQDFTLEMMISPADLSSSEWQVLLGTYGVSTWFELQIDHFRARWVANGDVIAATAGHGIAWATGAWFYVAACRSSGVLTLRCNGAVGTGADANNYSVGKTTRPLLGISMGMGNYNGYVDEIRLTLGVARDVSVIPTAPFPTGPVLGGTIVPFDIQSDSIVNATPIQIDGEWVIYRHDGVSYQAETAGDVVSVGDTRGVGYSTEGNAYCANIAGTEIAIYSNLDSYLGSVRRKVPGQSPTQTDIVNEVYPADSISGARVATVWGFEYDDVMYLFAWEYIYPDLNGPYLYSTTDGLSAVKIKEQDFNGSGGISITRVGEYLFAIGGGEVSRAAIADVLNPTVNAAWSVCATGLDISDGVLAVRGYGTKVVAAELNGTNVAVSLDSGATWATYSATSYGGFAMPVAIAVTGAAAMVLLTDGSVMATPLPTVSWTRATPTGLPASPESIYMPVVGTASTFVAVPNGATLFSTDGLSWVTS